MVGGSGSVPKTLFHSLELFPALPQSLPNVQKLPPVAGTTSIHMRPLPTFHLTECCSSFRPSTVCALQNSVTSLFSQCSRFLTFPSKISPGHYYSWSPFKVAFLLNSRFHSDRPGRSPVIPFLNHSPLSLQNFLLWSPFLQTKSIIQHHVLDFNSWVTIFSTPIVLPSLVQFQHPKDPDHHGLFLTFSLPTHTLKFPHMIITCRNSKCTS